MKFGELLVFGDVEYRGACPAENTDQINFFSWLSFGHTEYAAIAIHPKNEGKRTWGQVAHDKKSGSLSAGASDIIIPCSVPFICEMKRADHTKSKWQKGQKEYLELTQKHGAFSCVALGFDGAVEAFLYYLKKVEK